MSFRDLGRFGVAALVVFGSLAACAGASADGDQPGSQAEESEARQAAQSALAQTQAEAPSQSVKKQCPCADRRFIGFTSNQYTVGLGVPGTCSLQPSVACMTDDDCVNSGNVGTCSGAQDFGDGFLAADALCRAQFADSAVCTSTELLESVRASAIADMPTAAWYNNALMLDSYRWSGSYTSPVWPLACCR